MVHIKSSSQVAKVSGAFGNARRQLLHFFLLLPLFFSLFAFDFDDVFAEGRDFQERVSLNPIPGLPGQIELTTENLRLERVRALLTIDDRLLVIPLRSEGKGAFRGIFPTPKKRMVFQFQLTYDGAGGRTELSERMEVSQTCDVAERAADPSERSREDLVKQAAALDQEVELLTYVSRMLDEGREGR